MKALLLLVLVLLACSPEPKNPSAAERASVVLLRSSLELGSDGDNGGTLEEQRFPACGAVATSPQGMVTAAHCVGVVGSDVTFVDYLTWWRTSNGSATARVARIDGELAVIDVQQQLFSWVLVDAAHDGPGTLVRGFEVTQTTVTGDHISTQLYHEDSGSGVFQGDSLVGIVIACDSANDSDCAATGGRFAPVLE